MMSLAALLSNKQETRNPCQLNAGLMSQTVAKVDVGTTVSDLTLESLLSKVFYLKCKRMALEHVELCYKPIIL